MIIKSIDETSYSGMFKVCLEEGTPFFIRQDYLKTLDISQIVDETIFIGNTLNSLLLNPKKENALAKIAPISNFLKVDRITIYKMNKGKLECDYTWTDESNVHKQMIEINNFSKIFRDFSAGTLVVNDTVDYKKKTDDDFIKVPPQTNAFVMICAGPERATDYIFCVEVFDKRRLWSSSQIMSMKIIAKIVMSHYIIGE